MNSGRLIPPHLRFPVPRKLAQPVEPVDGQQLLFGEVLDSGPEPIRLMCKGIRVHAKSDPVSVENVSEKVGESEEDRVPKPQVAWQLCWRDPDDFSRIDLMIARGWGDVDRWLEDEEKGTFLPNPDFADWQVKLGPDASFAKQRKANVSKGLVARHAARKRQGGFGFGVLRTKEK